MSDLRVSFRFYGDLKLFLSQRPKRRALTCPVKGSPAVKDTIEALGIPHGEVDAITINGRSVGFYEPVKADDKICVYPDSSKIRAQTVKKLRPGWPARPRFVLDAHLGKLARYLRLLGFDCLYKADYRDEDIVETAAGQKRIVLSRDVGLLKNKKVRYGYFPRQTDPLKQIREIIKQFNLSARINPFHRCLECNGLIRRAPKSQILHRLPSRAVMYYKEFFICRSCGKVYWKGSHYQELSAVVRKFISLPKQERP